MTLPIFYYAQGTSWLFNELGITVSQALNDPYVEVFGHVVSQGAPTLPSHVKGLDGQIFPWDGQIPNDPFPLMLDTNLWQYKRVQYPASAIFIGPSIEIGVEWVVADILSNPVGTPWAIGGYSQGAALASRIYQEARVGRLKDRRADMKAIVGFGNPMREAGHTYPGSSGYSGACDMPDSTTGGGGTFPSLDMMGMFDIFVNRFARLIDTEDLFWNFTMPNEVIGGVGNSSDGLDMQRFTMESLRVLPIASLLTIGHVMGDLWTKYGCAPAGVPQTSKVVKVVDPYNGAELLMSGGGHIMYPYFPPPDANGVVPAQNSGYTCYQIALQHLREVGQRLWDEAHPTVPIDPTYPTYSWYSTLPGE